MGIGFEENENDDTVYLLNLFGLDYHSVNKLAFSIVICLLNYNYPILSYQIPTYKSF